MISSFQRTVIGLLTVAVSAMLLPSAAQAQEERQRFDFSSYLTRLDTNKNGQLDPSEISGRTESWLKREGYDVSKPISVKKIVEKATEDRERRDSGRDRDRRSESSKVTLKVPAFGATESPIPAFGPSDVAPLAARFSDSVNKQVDETLGRYDRNNNGMLDRDELERARWGSPRPEESDTNGDGRLSRTELANRYYVREQYSRESESKTSSSSRDSDSRSDSRSRYSSSRSSDDRGGSTYSSRSPSSSSRSGSSSSRSSYTPSRSSSSSASPSSSSSSTSRDKYASYAESLIKNYDEDKDGKLSKDEVKKMRRPPVGADQDNDGTITKDELIDSLSGANKASKDESDSDSKSDSSAEKKSYTSSRSSSGSSRSSSSRSRSSSSFSGLDANEDNQVQMHEFSEEWDDKKVEEFYEKDKNGDGVITLREWNDK